MTTTIKSWLKTLWTPPKTHKDILLAYSMTFRTPFGAIVLEHLMDEVYCTICPEDSPTALAEHNGRRSVVDEILRNIDTAESPNKYGEAA